MKKIIKNKKILTGLVLFLIIIFSIFLISNRKSEEDVLAAADCVSGGGVTCTATTVGEYTVNTYIGTGTTSWTPPSGVTQVEVLVVGGGGGGGSDGNTTGGGGGGAGEYKAANGVSVSGSTTITVGAGGTAGIASSFTQAGNGGSSVFGSLTAIGGGGGSSYQSRVGSNGASGGGGNYDAAGGIGTTGFGGGWGRSTLNARGGGGGGGAGAAGTDGSGTAGGNGGAGVYNSITGTSVAYAGGGGGGLLNYLTCSTPGAGGAGGGGAGGACGGNYVGNPGTAGTGGGGGGGSSTNTGVNGGAGGSGIVIIKYKVGGTTDCITGSGVICSQSTVSSYVVNKYILSGSTTASTTWIPPSGVTSAEYLVVAGGGGGGCYEAGGGGAGGYRTGTLTGLSGSQTITVGAGGAGGTSEPVRGSNGADSVFSSITSIGGGGGGSQTLGPGLAGGSGGGGNDHGGTLYNAGGAGTSGQGYAGGTGIFGGNRYGAGGGGSSSVGADSQTSTGGAGTQSSITGTATWYAAGGGGGCMLDSGRLGGSGIGGKGGSGGNADATSGVPNTGSGGGGGGKPGGVGASGVVIIKYLPDTTAPTLAQVTAVPSPTGDSTPNYTFSSTEAGTITYGGSCSSATTSATTGNNTITFNALAAGTYSNCTIRVTDGAGNPSSYLSVNTFTVDTTGPTIAQVTAVPSPTKNNTPSYTFSSTKAGTITYGGSCSSATTSATTGNNTVTFNALAAGTYSNCTIRVTDSASNQSNLLTVNTFIVDTSCVSGGGVTCTSSEVGSFIVNQYVLSGTTTGTTTWTPPTGVVSAEYLVVAGGGGGTAYNSGAGGAGGVRGSYDVTGGGGALESPLSVTSGVPTTVTVGAGGTGYVRYTVPSVANNNGGNSVFGSITSLGGGYGADASATPFYAAHSGGSGGGGCYRAGYEAGASGTSGQGYAGGNGGIAGPPYGGGGGGAGGSGANYNAGGAGGIGVTSSITGSGVVYATGGYSRTPPHNGAANTGNGGDGSGDATETFYNGGSGIVIIRFAPDTTPPTLAQVTAVPSPTNDNTPNYTFSSTEAGTIAYSGGCASSTTSAIAGNNTITFNTLIAGSHSGCTIKVTDALGNQSTALTVNTFSVTTGNSCWYCSHYYDESYVLQTGKNGYLDFKFTYGDGNSSATLSGYRIAVDTTDLSLANIDSQADIIVPDTSTWVSGGNAAIGAVITNSQISVKSLPSTELKQLGFGNGATKKTYYWWVKVKNSVGAESAWIPGSSFYTPKKHYPIVRVALDKTAISPGADAQYCVGADITDDEDPCYSVCWKGTGTPVVDPENTNWKCSICYDSSNSPVSCSTLSDPSTLFTWRLPSAYTEGVDYTLTSGTLSSANPIIKLTNATADFKMGLLITGSSCAAELDTNVQAPMPTWKEISPF